MAGIAPGLDGFLAAQQMGQQRQAQELGVLSRLAQLKQAQEASAQAAEMRPLQMDLLRSQIAEKNNQAAALLGQRDAQGKLSRLMSTESGPLQADSVALNEAEAIRRIQENQARGGAPMTVNVPNPANVRSLTALAFPKEYGKAQAEAMFKEPKIEAPSALARLIKERYALPAGDPRATIYDAAINRQTTHAPAPSATVKVDNFTPASEEAQKDFMKSTRATYDQLKQAPAVLNNIEEVKKLIPNAKMFMGTGGEPLLDSVKFLNNRLGLNIATDGVKSAEELRSRTFFQILDNLKKMDAQPSQQQQAVMRDALGQLGSDPNALGNILDAFGDAIRTKVDLHNKEVFSAESKGVKFPYSPIIDLPQPRRRAADQTGAAGGTGVRRYNPATGRIE